MSKSCEKCGKLMELYESIENLSDRDYYIMTELFVMLHGKDCCEKAQK